MEKNKTFEKSKKRTKIVGIATIALVSALVFVGVSIGCVSAATIYVPDDYAKIQWAVDNATAGDTIIARDGIYIENVNIYKRLTIQSENGPDSTTIKAAYSTYQVISLTADYVTISGFTITGAAGPSGGSNGGIHLSPSSNSDITNNVIKSNRVGINGRQINCLIRNNTIKSNGANDIHFSRHGVYRIPIMTNNNIGNINTWHAASQHKIYLNNIGSLSYIDSPPICNSPEKITYTYNGSTYTNYLGNYWSGYTGSDADGDGIGGTSYRGDNYPLMTPFENYLGGAPVPQPDLTPTAITAPATQVLNEPSTITATITNVGEVDAGSFNVTLSANGVVVNTVSVPSLNVSASTTTSFNWTPASVGYIELCVVADSEAIIDEMSEANNIKCTIVTVPAPDITPTAITAPALILNESSTITATIANIGVLDALSFNVSLSADGNVVGTTNVPPLSAGASTSVSFEWTPASVGYIELCVVADTDDAIAEMDEANNTKCTIVTVPAPDITPTAINVPALIVDLSSTITATIENIGVLDAPSFNVSLSANGAVVGTVNVPSLSAGNTMTVSFVWTPASTGAHKLCVVADTDDAIVEMDEANNEKCIVVTVTEMPEGVAWWYLGAGMPWDVERLSNGNTLITEFGNHTVIEITPLTKKIIYGTGTAGSGPGELNSPFDAERLSSENTLITDSKNHRVIEVDTGGNIVWQYGNGTHGDGINQLSYPMDAEQLVNGNTLITDEHNCRVIELRTSDYDTTKPNNNFTADSIVWQYGTTGVSGSGPNELNYPKDADRLSNGNTLIADYRNHRVIEVTQDKNVVWQYGTGSPDEPSSGPNELNNPTDAERLPNNNTLITDNSNHRVIEVTPAKKIIGQYGTSEVAGSGENELNRPADAERLENGNTLIADTINNRIIEVIALPPPAPSILSFAPPSPFYDAIGAVRTFSITIDQTVDVEWQINGVVVQSDAGVTESSYTNTSAQEGTWTVTAIASNANGTDMQQWDWTVVSALGPDLTVFRIDAYHNKTLYPKENYPPYFNLSNEVDVIVTNIGTEPAGSCTVSLYIESEFIGKLPVSGIDPGNAIIVQFKWTPVGYDCEDGGSPQTYMLKAIADCDNAITESDETNNELTAEETAYWAGYSADEELVEASHGVIRGGLLYTTGDGSYVGLYSHGSYKDTHYNIELPAGATVKHARLNVYYTWSRTKVYPVMVVNITTTTGTYTVPLAASYNDRPCPSPAIAFEYPWGNYVYDLTPYITESGSYTVTVKNSGTAENPSSFCPAAPGLVILYEDSSMPEYEYWILEGADVVEGGRRGGAGYLSLEECTNNATFNGIIDLSKVSSATVGIVSIWGGEAWGEWSSHYWFNDNYLGDGRILDGYFELYDKTIDGMSMYVGASGNAQVGSNVSDVTDYLKASGNIVTFGDNGDSMMPANAFLLVERCRAEKPKPAVLVPFMVSGFVSNCSDGTPINNPDVTIKNVNTCESLPSVETQNGSNYYQILTSLDKVSCGDVLRFRCNRTSLKHRVRQSEIDAGGFEQNCMVGLIEAIEAGVTFSPKKLDLNSSGVLKAYITLPEGYDVANISVSTVECEGAPVFGFGKVISGKQALEVKFKIQNLTVPTGDAVLLTVTGELYDGTPFEASNTVKVV